MLAVIYFFSDSKNKQVCSLDNEYVVNNGPGVGRVTSIQLICPVNVFEAAIFRLFFFLAFRGGRWRWRREESPDFSAKSSVEMDESARPRLADWLRYSERKNRRHRPI